VRKNQLVDACYLLQKRVDPEEWIEPDYDDLESLLEEHAIFETFLESAFVRSKQNGCFVDDLFLAVQIVRYNLICINCRFMAFRLLKTLPLSTKLFKSLIDFLKHLRNIQKHLSVYDAKLAMWVL